MTENLVPAVRTTPTMAEYIRAVFLAWPAVETEPCTKAACAVLWAQYMIETGFVRCGRACDGRPPGPLNSKDVRTSERDANSRRRGAEDLFVEANQPPPAKVTETPGQAEALPEPGPEVTEAREASEAKPGQECAGVIVRPGHPPVSVRWRLDGDVVHVTVAVPGRIDSVSTAVTVGGVKP